MKKKMDNNETISYKLLGFNAFLVISIVIMVFAIYGSMQKPILAERKEAEKQIADSKIFNDLNLQAKAVYVYDINEHKIIFQKNESAQLPLASLTKLMTALTAIDLAPKNSKITIRKEFLKEQGDSGLKDGEVWKMSDLLDFSLIVSSNDGARSVASVIGATINKTNNYDIGRADFIKKMNEKAVSLGMKQTYFLNESGLDESTSQSGAYGSAQDIAKLLEYMMVHNPEILEATKLSKDDISSLSKTHNAQNTNIDIGKIPNLIASKTGYTDLAGGNLVIAFDESIGHPIIIVVLGSTQEGRFTDVMTLASTTMQYARQNK